MSKSHAAHFQLGELGNGQYTNKSTLQINMCATTLASIICAARLQISRFPIS
uniref:Uncharacterized protein n=1 Tax=Arion vulgaris TaxID=1028688 RepID=A0A0B6YC87_9EUPU